MGESEFLQACRDRLDELWREASESPISDDSASAISSCPGLADDIRHCVNSATKTYRYVLPTQLLAKIVNADLDSRCVQASRGGRGAFDARTIAHEVIVPFDRANELVLGGSPEPYVNNPLRIAAISPEHRDAQKNKVGWDALCRILDEVENRNSPQFTRSVLDHTLRCIAERLEGVRVVYPAPRRISLAGAVDLVLAFLSERSGGDRFESVTSALFLVAGQRFGLFSLVKRASTNAADRSAKMLGDIECVDSSGKIVMVVEAKDRALTIRQVEDKVPGLRENKIAEAFFVAGKGIAPDDEDEVRQLVAREFASGQNLYVTELEPLARVLLAMIGEAGRREFLERIGRELDAYSDLYHRRAWAKLLSTA